MPWLASQLCPAHTGNICHQVLSTSYTLLVQFIRVLDHLDLTGLDDVKDGARFFLSLSCLVHLLLLCRTLTKSMPHHSITKEVQRSVVQIVKNGRISALPVAAILYLCKWGLCGTASTCVPFLNHFYSPKVPLCQRKQFYYKVQCSLNMRCLNKSTKIGNFVKAYIAGILKKE